MIKCFCCLSESEGKSSFNALTAAERKLYQELTKLDLDFEQKLLKICKTCKDSLKTSVKFVQICIKSYEQLKAESSEKKPEIKRTRKRKSQVESDVDDPPPEHLQQDSDEDDELPISAIQQQLKKEKETTLASPELQSTEEQDEIKPLESKKTSAKYLCPECGISFQTSQRLQIHSFTHSGVKSFLCQYDSCGKSFATSEFNFTFKIL